MRNLFSCVNLLQVKVIVNLKGRENEFRNIAIELIKRFQNDIGEVMVLATHRCFISKMQQHDKNIASV